MFQIYILLIYWSKLKPYFLLSVTFKKKHCTPLSVRLTCAPPPPHPTPGSKHNYELWYGAVSICNHATTGQVNGKAVLLHSHLLKKVYKNNKRGAIQTWTSHQQRTRRRSKAKHFTQLTAFRSRPKPFYEDEEQLKHHINSLITACRKYSIKVNI